jgi:hypothetical protein
MIELLTSKKTEFVLEWLSTALVIIGACLTAFNVYPINIYFQFVGNVGWFVVGYMWNKWSLMVIQAVISVIYIVGLISKGYIL